jgi:hypothetical protein
MLTPLAGNYSATGGTCDRIRTTSPNLGSRLACAESLIPVDPFGKFFRAKGTDRQEEGTTPESGQHALLNSTGYSRSMTFLCAVASGI